MGAAAVMVPPVVTAFALGVVMCAVAFMLPIPPSSVSVASSRVRYPGEEAAAVRACQGQGQKVMYWWLEDPRKNSVTLHARCTGVVSVTAEVKL